MAKPLRRSISATYDEYSHLANDESTMSIAPETLSSVFCGTPEQKAIVETAATKLKEELTQQLNDLSFESVPASNLYALLLGENSTGDRTLLKAFSDRPHTTTHPNGTSHNPTDQWVSSLPIWAQMLLIEPEILAELDRLKQTLIALSASPEYAEYEQRSQHYNSQLQQLSHKHKQKKQQRDRQRRQLSQPSNAQQLIALQQQSQQDGIERRRLKQKRDQALEPLRIAIAQSQQQIKALKQQYKTLSQAWQTQMQRAHRLDQSSTILHLLPPIQETIEKKPIPLHQRASAKLLHHAFTHQLTPLALQEFEWNPLAPNDSQSKDYSHSFADQKRLSALCTLNVLTANSNPNAELPILYQDPHLLVIDKPAGLLSVPGRSYQKQDSALTRLRQQLSHPSFIQPVHRLDQATSGLLIIALSQQSHAALSQQFAQQKVQKKYEAILSKPIAAETGSIDLPLQADPEHPLKQTVNLQTGKPSQTQFRILATGPQPRIEFLPSTGRTHQLRVHAAHPLGLNSPILGDSLYGLPHTTEQVNAKDRLCLHAIAIQFTHPITHQPLRFHSAVPF